MRKIIVLSLIFLMMIFKFWGEVLGESADIKNNSLGVWVSIFSKEKVLYSKDEALNLIDTCKKSGVNQIYLQIYQSGNAYYDSSFLPRAKYTDMLKASQGQDMIDFLLKKAQENNIKVFAWINILSIGNNDKADIIDKFGREVLTRDQYGRISGRSSPNDSDKYYLREELLFLEPGDQRVAKYLISVVEEVIERYPLFSGVHLDYIRYPMTVPFIPGSRFTNQGLSYGYGVKNVERFSDWIKLSPVNGLKSIKDYLAWDDWRRNQITSLVRRISKKLKEKSPDLLISCAVVPSAERAYSSMFQDWAFWLEEGIIDYAILMNYTFDNQLTKQLVRSAVSLRGKGKVFIGVGLYLIKDSPNDFLEQYKIASSLGSDGIVIFAYDDLKELLVKDPSVLISLPKGR